MSPLDDELRRALTARAAAVSPPPDPMAGIERRARRLRRRRGLAAVGSAAVAAAVVALVVPAAVDRVPPAPRHVTSPSTSPAASASPAVLDPANPWPLRGDEVLLGDGTLDTVQRAWGRRHPGSSLTPLMVQTWEPSGRTEIAFVASGDGALRVGWVILRSGGPDFVLEEAAVPDAAYQFALPGDEGVTRLYVVAAPESRVLYAADGVTYREITQHFVTHQDGFTGGTTTDLGGVGVTAVETQGARVRVVAADGGVLYEADARGAPGTAPANLLDWPARGDSSVGPSVEDLKAAYRRATPTESGAVHYRPLFAGDTDSGVRFAVGQVWRAGDSRAETVSYAVGGERGPVLQLYGSTEDRAAAVVALITSLPGTSVDLLVVVPVPGTGQVSHDDDASGAFRPVTGMDHLDGVVLIDRARGETDDRLEVLDGDGDLDRPLYRGPVAPFLETMR